MDLCKEKLFSHQFALKLPELFLLSHFFFFRYLNISHFSKHSAVRCVHALHIYCRWTAEKCALSLCTQLEDELLSLHFYQGDSPLPVTALSHTNTHMRTLTHTHTEAHSVHIFVAAPSSNRKCALKHDSTGG